MTELSEPGIRDEKPGGLRGGEQALSRKGH